VFADSKALRQRRSLALWPGGEPALELEGFELHRGLSQLQAQGSGDACQPIAAAAELGWWQPLGERGGMVAGTYLHGVFESGAWRRRWLNGLRQRKGLGPLSETVPHHSQQREALLDRLADAFEAHVNLEPLLR
jgi:adenosylcobyric acid synthase